MPFSIEQFLAVFAQYNQAVWLMQAVLVLAGLITVALIVRRNRQLTPSTAWKGDALWHR